MSNNTVAIIGGGMAGLSAGIYLQKNGYAATIYEKCSNCGGVSVSWKRRGYTFDGATNWLAGSGPGSSMHGLLREILDFSKLSFVDSEEFAVVEHQGQRFHVYSDAGRLEEEMLRISPKDGRAIKTFCRAIRRAGSFHIPYDTPPELLSPLSLLLFPFAHLSFISFYLRWKGIRADAFALRFRSQVLRDFVMRIFPHHGHFSIFSIIMTLGWMHVKSGGYPLGGSETIIGQMEERFRTLGGTIRYNSPVDRIRVEKGRAVGLSIRGKHIDAATIISTADEVHTRDVLLGGQGIDSAALAVRNSRAVFPALMQISLGLRRSFEGEAHKIVMDLPEALVLGSHRASDMMVRICNFDPTLAPTGCTSVIVHIRTPDWQYWAELRASDPDAYRAEKDRVAAAVIDALEERFGHIKDALDVVDVATPATFIRYNNLFKGSYQGWAPTPALVGKTLKKTIPGLRNFHMSGQWQWAAGGIPGVMRLGRHMAQILCARDGKKFSA